MKENIRALGQSLNSNKRKICDEFTKTSKMHKKKYLYKSFMIESRQKFVEVVIEYYVAAKPAFKNGLSMFVGSLFNGHSQIELTNFMLKKHNFIDNNLYLFLSKTYGIRLISLLSQ